MISRARPRPRPLPLLAGGLGRCGDGVMGIGDTGGRFEKAAAAELGFIDGGGREEGLGAGSVSENGGNKCLLDADGNGASLSRGEVGEVDDSAECVGIGGVLALARYG